MKFLEFSLNEMSKLAKVKHTAQNLKRNLKNRLSNINIGSKNDLAQSDPQTNAITNVLSVKGRERGVSEASVRKEKN